MILPTSFTSLHSDDPFVLHLAIGQTLYHSHQKALVSFPYSSSYVSIVSWWSCSWNNSSISRWSSTRASGNLRVASFLLGGRPLWTGPPFPAAWGHRKWQRGVPLLRSSLWVSLNKVGDQNWQKIFQRDSSQEHAMSLGGCRRVCLVGDQRLVPPSRRRKAWTPAHIQRALAAPGAIQTRGCELKENLMMLAEMERRRRGNP